MSRSFSTDVYNVVNEGSPIPNKVLDAGHSEHFQVSVMNLGRRSIYSLVLVWGCFDLGEDSALSKIYII